MTHLDFIEIAYLEAKIAFDEGEVPIGCIIVDANQKIIAKTHNQKEATALTTNHAEILAIKNASREVDNWRLIDCSLYVTIEPCMMCVGALLHARVKNIYYGWQEPKFGALDSCIKFRELDYGNHRFTKIENLQHQPSAQIMSDFFKARR